MKPHSMKRDVCVRFYCTESEARDIERMSKDFGHTGTISSEIHSIALHELNKWRQGKSIAQMDLFN